MPIAQKFAVRLVLDTNTAISGLLWYGTPGRLVDAAYSGSIKLCTSGILLAELRGVLARDKFSRQLETRGLNSVEVFNGYAALTTIVVPAIIHPIIIQILPTMPYLPARLGRKLGSLSQGIVICSISRSTREFGL